MCTYTCIRNMMHIYMSIYMYLLTVMLVVCIYLSMYAFGYAHFSRYGPLINHWTTRFEAKHKYFKHLANVMGNFTNICYSLALRHQMHQCYLSLNRDTLPGEKIEIGPGTVISVLYMQCTCPVYHDSIHVRLYF